MAYASSATFYKIWLEHNVTHNGQKCLAIHVKVTANGMKGRTLTCVAYVDSPKGTAHRDINNNYHSTDGQVSAQGTGKCTYEGTQWDDFVIYLPNNEIHPKSGTNDYYIHVEAWDGSTYIGRSDYTSFSMTGNGFSGSSNAMANGSVNNQGVWYSDDGSIMYSKCVGCDASGKHLCLLCKGKGMRISYSTDMYVVCSACGGMGYIICSMCAGIGIFSMPTPTGGGYSGGGYSGSYDAGGSSSSGSSRQVCHACGGTGKGVDEIKYSPNYTGSMTKKYCSICGYDVDSHHYHIQHSCPSCHGKGYIDF